MSNFLSELAQNITPYAAGEQPRDKKYIKLNTNENPYPPSPAVKKAIEEFDYRGLKLYPDPDSNALKEALSRLEDVSVDNIFTGNGSDEVLALCFPAFFDRGGKPIAFADITYSFYPVYCEFFGIPYNNILLKEDYTMDAPSYMSLSGCGGIIIANPNAPTGEGVPLNIIEDIVKSNADKPVIIDEAYMDFYRQSAVPLTKKYNNLLVVKTFSKSYSLAGIRCGYAVGSEDLIDGLNRCKNSFNSYPLDALCQSVCIAAVLDRAYYDGINQRVILERGRLEDEFKRLGLKYIPSSANFILAGKKAAGESIYSKLKERGILVRFFKKPKLEDFVRITVGTKEDNDTLIAALKEITSTV